MSAELLQGDCLEILPTIAAGSVDLVLTDPPYGTIKSMKNPERPNSWGKEGYKALPNVPYNYSMIWEKDNFANSLLCKKAPVSYYEDVLVFSKKYDGEGLHPLRPYFKSVLNFIGLNLKAINARLGHRQAEHTFYVESTQYGLCTAETYQQLIDVFNIDQMPGFLLFEELSKEDSTFKSTFKSTFNLPDGKKYKSNILKYSKDLDGYHPTQKPVALLMDLIKTYSNPGDLVLDFTMGSGSTGVAARNTGRRFIGIEQDEKFFQISQHRINGAERVRDDGKSGGPKQLKLF